MPLITNLFLILYLLDGELSLVDEVLSMVSTSNLSDVRAALANLVLILALPMYLALGINRRLPKRVFLPLTLYVLWCPLSTWIFPSLADLPWIGLATALVQLLLYVLPLSFIRQNGGEGLIVTAEMLPPPAPDMAGTVLFWGSSAILIPATFVLFGLAMTNAYIEGNTAGFMHLRPAGLYMTEKVYRGDHKTIRLISMIHVGEKTYYDSLVSSIASPRTVVLAEGVTDQHHLLRSRFGYGKVAGVLGLVSQEKMQLKGRVIDAADLDTSVREGDGEGKEPDIVRADVDMSSFRPTTIDFLNALGKYLTSGGPFAKQMTEFYKWTDKNVTPEMNEVILNDILYQRNKQLIAELGKALSRYDTVVIPWGALHMPEIEEAVVKRGFKLQEERERDSVDFGRILAHKLK